MIADFGLAALIAFLTFAATLVYRQSWRSLCGEEQTPTGFGVLLALPMLVGAIASATPAPILACYGVILLSAGLYWIDDVAGLGVRQRLMIQFVVGSILAGLILYPFTLGGLGVCLVLIVSAGLLNVVATNLVNFYDGADLNLGLFIALTAGAVLAFASHNPSLATPALLMIGFVAGFGWVNQRARTLYLGDTGAFAFAGFLTLSAAIFVRNLGEAPLIWSAAALPALDVFFVLVLRLVKREDLLSRNYHHLYQRLQIERGGFYYLIPQIVNVALIIPVAIWLHSLGLGSFLSAMVSMIAVTIVFYVSCRLALLKPPRLF